MFTYHRPTPEQGGRYDELRAKAKEYAYLIQRLTPDCEDRRTALWWLRTTSMAVNAAIACNEPGAEAK